MTFAKKMKFHHYIIFLVLALAPCRSEEIWKGGDELQLSLASGKNPIGGWNSPNGDELSFIIRRARDSAIFYPGSGVGEVTGLIREGLAADARGRTVRVKGWTIEFRNDGGIEIIFVFNAKGDKSEYPVLLTRSEALKLVQVAGAFFDERIAKKQIAEEDTDLD